MSQTDLEAYILDLVDPYQKKLAFVIGAAVIKFGVTEEQVAEKIYSMCEAGQLKAHGNISDWRHSEISLPDA